MVRRNTDGSLFVGEIVEKPEKKLEEPMEEPIEESKQEYFEPIFEEAPVKKGGRPRKN